MLALATPAKLNLFLEIKARRPDGFHELETVMMPIDLYDSLEFVQKSLPNHLTLTCSDPTLPTDSRNLVKRAAEFWPQANVEIALTKRIPSQAGMGGGSSDAAATLNAMESMFGPTDRPIDQLANSLGSDVGFFLYNQTSLCTGRGEIVEPLEVNGEFHFVAVQPPVGCPTPEVYRRVTPPANPQSSEAARKALKSGDCEQLAAGMFNRLQEPAFAVAPDMKRVYSRLLDSDPLAVQVTGSGSAVFALARSRTDAIRIAGEYRMSMANDQLWIVRNCKPDDQARSFV